MDIILDWAKNYSAPIVILLVCGATLIYLLQRIVEKAIDAQFEVRSKRLEILLQRRSNFEEKILLDQYAAVSDLQLRIKKIEADINRHRHGVMVEGLINGNDIVPLSEVFVELEAKSFMLKERLCDLLKDEVRALISFANEDDPAKVKSCEQQILNLNTELRTEMDSVFGIDQITWDNIGQTINDSLS